MYFDKAVEQLLRFENLLENLSASEKFQFIDLKMNKDEVTK